MPSLPPPVWAELFFDDDWNNVTRDVRQTSTISATRGLTSESASEAEPTTTELTLDSRDHKYAPRNPMSELYGKIGRNTPFRWGYRVGSPWGLMPGTDGNELTTPTQTAFNVTDLDLRIDIALDDWERQQNLAARWVATGNNRSWGLYLAGTGQLALIWSATGSATSITEFSTIPVLGYNGQRMAIRVTLDVNNGAGGYDLRFYTGRTVHDEEWAQLGDPITGGSTTAVFGASAGLELGDFLGLALPATQGRVHALKLMTSIGGTTAAYMTTQDASPGVSSFTSNGLVWTVAAPAVLTNKHIRMLGEVPAWPPTRDLSGNDTVVDISPAGITRRMDAGSKPQDSALLRYIKANSPVECWPMTDGATAEAFKSIVGGVDMNQEIVIGTDTAVVKAAGTLADWVEPVLSAKANTTAYVSAGMRSTAGTDALWSFDIFLSGGGPLSTGTFRFKDRGAGTDANNRVDILVIMTGSLNRLSVIRESYGDTASSSSLLSNIDNVGIYDNDPHHIRLTIDPGVTNTAWTLYVDGVSVGSGTISSIVVKSLRSVVLGWGFASGDGMTDRAFGYFTYWDGDGPTAAQIWSAYTGFQGERAGARIVRLAEESGYVATVTGETVFQQPMGIQGRKTLLELLNDANRTNFGFLLENRTANELIHRSSSTLWNQPPALTLDFSSGVVGSPFKPVDDDKLTENDVTVNREYGSRGARQVLEEGALSVLDFPDGVGRYDKEYTYSLYTDLQADQVAYMRLHLGTYDGVRYTRLTLDLANERVFQMVDEILRIDVGDKILLSNVPEDHGPDDVDLLVQGYSEEAGPDSWKITFNCVPAEPWNALVTNSSTYGIVDTAGSETSEDLDSTETGVDVFTTALYRWVDSATYASDFPFDVRTGGEVMRVTACTSGVLDTFTRSVSDGWGSPDVGTAWVNVGNAGTDFDVTGSVGTHTLTNVDVSRVSTSASSGVDFDVMADIATAALATGGPQYVGVVARHTDANNMYFVQLEFATSAAVTMTLRKRVAGVETTLATLASGSTGLTHVANTFIRIRLQVIGSTIQAKAWLTSNFEPVAWMLTATDSGITTGSNVGVRSVRQNANTNANLVVSFDNFNLLNPQTFTVTRSINGVRKSHSSGQDFRLAHPVYVAP